MREKDEYNELVISRKSNGVYWSRRCSNCHSRHACFLIQLIAGKNKKRELLKFLLALLVVVASLGTFMYAALTVEMPKSDTIVAVMDKINDNEDYQKYGIEANQLTTSMINEWGASGDISPEKDKKSSITIKSKLML